MKTKKAIKGFLYGSIFGFGSPVPGVSAGTVAILLNVYDDFFNSIGMEYVKKNMLAIISFLIGWALGLFGISRIIVFLFENHGQVMGFAFIGLILGCVPLIFKKATLSSSTGGKIRAVEIIFFVPAFVFMIFVAFFGGGAANGSIEYINGVSAADLAWIFFASLVSSMAMLIPGVGGSLMMLVFGIYGIYIEAIAALDVLILVTFGVSMILGVLAGIVLTKKLLERFSQALYFAILGFVMGSLLIVYPWFSFDLTGLVSVFAAFFCCIFAFWLSKKG